MINHSPIRPHPDSKLPEAPLADITSERDVQVGVALMVTAMLMLPGIDAIAKYLSSEMSPGQISWGRFFFQSIFLGEFLSEIKSISIREGNVGQEDVGWVVGELK